MLMPPNEQQTTSGATMLDAALSMLFNKLSTAIYGHILCGEITAK